MPQLILFWWIRAPNEKEAKKWIARRSEEKTQSHPVQFANRPTWQTGFTISGSQASFVSVGVGVCRRCLCIRTTSIALLSSGPNGWTQRRSTGGKILCLPSVWSVYMISASNCQTPYKKLTRIVKGPTNRKSNEINQRNKTQRNKVVYQL